MTFPTLVWKMWRVRTSSMKSWNSALSCHTAFSLSVCSSASFMKALASWTDSFDCLIDYIYDFMALLS